MGTAQDFFMQYLAAPVVLGFWAVGWLWKRQPFLRTKNIDVDTGLREFDWDEINAERSRLAALPAWRRILHHAF